MIGSSRGRAPSKHARRGPYTKNGGVHPTKLDPSKSNLPKDPVTGKILAVKPDARQPRNQVVVRLAKRDISKAFEMLGGVEGLVKWAKKHDKNMYAFYVHIWPKLLGAQALDEAAEKLSTRPTIVRIENVIVDPVDDTRSRVINDLDPGPSSFSREASEAELVVREGISRQAQEAGLGEEEASWVADRMTEIPL